MASNLPISDEAIRLLLLGTPNDVDAAITILWTHLAPGLAAYALSILPAAQSGDCKDVVIETFVTLLGNPTGVRGAVEDFLRTVVRNKALGRCRKQEVRSRPINDPVILDQLQPAAHSAPDQILLEQEKKTANSNQVKAVFEALEEAAAEMGAKEKDVAVIMLRIMRKSARWPTSARIHEELQAIDRTLREVTVKDRRKEVMKKFNPVLTNYGRNQIED